MDIPAVIDLSSGIVGLISAVAATGAWLRARALADDLAAERASENEVIGIVLDCEDGRTRSLPVHLRRREFSRAEVLGRLGMMPMRSAGARFSLRFLATPQFLADLDRVQSVRGNDTLRIPCSIAEFEQFV